MYDSCDFVLLRKATLFSLSKKERSLKTSFGMELVVEKIMTRFIFLFYAFFLIVS